MNGEQFIVFKILVAKLLLSMKWILLCKKKKKNLICDKILVIIIFF